ncbi:MAG: 16S rRNA (guanine(527)-N(7))-methyltransferase RsmG [Mogibacterium sp.]|nr:16S rRNA (guanine(527)-N(7))-methyltransferase RsmG [Mogibacterium sp.]
MSEKIEVEKYIDFLRQSHGAETAEKLLAYVDRVLEINEHINLTAVRDRDEAIIKHLADSLSVLELPEFWEAESIVDVGTGAGFPGALLAIACPSKSFTLLDSTLKKLRVIDGLAEELGIENIKTVHARAEEVGRQEYEGAFDLCVSRAVADLEKLSGWCLPFVRKGGAFLSYKGDNYAVELEGAIPVIQKAKARFDRVVPANTNFSEINGHVLLIIKK